jgi:hypothetical protein
VLLRHSRAPDETAECSFGTNYTHEFFHFRDHTSYSAIHQPAVRVMATKCDEKGAAGLLAKVENEPEANASLKPY